ncbi:MAG: tetratricopeptide repeat protein, partial [Chitinophagaceae bacterium]|nr:tetratricopeptide repeat protein [Chitinophagaceae bacterium]
MFNDDFFNDDELEDFDEILKEFFKMKNDAPHHIIDEEDFEFLIDYFTINNDKENHIYACEKAVSLYPYSSELLIRKAECYISQKKYGQALKTIDQLEEISPNNINAVFLKSDILLEQNRFTEAAHVLESNLDFFEGNEKTDILLELSEVYDELEDYKKVYQVLKDALLYQPNNEEALLKICFWAEINSLQEDSIELHQHIIDEYPYNPLAWYNLGVAYQGLKLYEKAIDSFSYCIAI